MPWASADPGVVSAAAETKMSAGPILRVRVGTEHNAFMNRCAYKLAPVPRRDDHAAVGLPLEIEEANALAEAMRAFGTASRLRLLWALVDEERTVDELTAATGMTQSAASHQLRLLRHARLVRVRRAGRHAYYRLHDEHVAELLAAIRHHHEHVTGARVSGLPSVDDTLTVAVRS